MYIEFDIQGTAEYLAALAQTEEQIPEIEKALYHLKAIAENKYNDEYFRTFLRMLIKITEFDYLED